MNTKEITNDKKAVIYCRVSSKEQVDEGNSLASQERICREYAIKEGYDIVEIFIEKGESAKTARRPELQRLLDVCTKRKGTVQAMIAYKVDRISRNIADYSVIRVRLKKAGVEIKSVTEYFEDTPAGRFMENIIANVGQFDNDVRAERCIGGMKEAAIEGRYVWMAPVGYNNEKVNGKSTIVPNSMASLMIEAFEQVASRSGTTEAVRLTMTEKGLVGKRGNPIPRAHFYRLLRNPLYKGTIRKFGQVYPGMFVPLVSEELFDDVQAVLKGRKNKIKHYLHENPDFPLRRFVLSEHGNQLTGYWARGKYKKYPYYSFSAPGTTIRKERLEELFMAFLARYTFDTQHLKVIKSHLEKYFGKYSEQQKSGSEAIQNRIAELNKQIDHLIKLQAEGNISTNIFTDRVKKCDEELDELKHLLKGKEHDKVNIGDLMAFAAQVLPEPGLLWEKASLGIRRKLQEFDFPQGVVFDGVNFRTPKVCSIYKVKDLIDIGLLRRADSRYTEKNTPATTNVPSSDILLLETKEFWMSVVEELRTLKTILTGI